MLGNSSFPLPPNPPVPALAQSNVLSPDSTSALNTLVILAASFTAFIRASPKSQLNEREEQCAAHVVPTSLKYQRFPENTVGADVTGAEVTGAAVTTGAAVGADDGAALPHTQQFVSAPYPAYPAFETAHPEHQPFDS